MLMQAMGDVGVYDRPYHFFWIYVFRFCFHKLLWIYVFGLCFHKPIYLDCFLDSILTNFFGFMFFPKIKFRFLVNNFYF
jgi:hypothetical protein